MKKIILTSFASPHMSRSLRNLEQSFRTHKYSEDDSIETFDGLPEIKKFFPAFYNQNKEILSAAKGAGYWLWKPLIIHHQLTWSTAIADGDYVLYADAGIEIIENLKYLVDINEDILLFNNEWPHIDWCKMDVMDGITPGWAHAGRTDRQVQASVLLIRKNQFTVRFVEDWLRYCQLPGYIDDSASKLPNVPTFREHRHDQAVLTCLQIKHGVPLHWWPADYNTGVRPKYQADKYPVMFYHHRKRNPGTNAVDAAGNKQPEWDV